jgi:isovaleryl-CoA dehydrogenase
MWITNGAISATELGDVFLVYARPAGGGRRDLSSYVVEKGMPGFSLGQRLHDKLGMRASGTAELVFDGCRVPAANRLGEDGQAMLHMMRNLEIERLTLAGMSVGIADRCVDIMVRHAQERRTFGSPILDHGQMQRYIAESYAMTEAAKCLVYHVAREVGPDSRNRIGSDAAKLFAAPVGKQVADNAMQVMGGAGYCREYPVERLWRDAKLLEIGGGTLEAHQKNLAKDLARMRPLQ